MSCPQGVAVSIQHNFQHDYTLTSQVVGQCTRECNTHHVMNKAASDATKEVTPMASQAPVQAIDRVFGIVHTGADAAVAHYYVT